MTGLERFGIDLTSAARNDKLDPVIGREEQTKELIEVLCRRRKNNAVLLGEPGVGKTAVAEGLAQKIANGEVPLRLLYKRIISLDLTLMIAGTRYRGEFEARLRRVIDEAKANPNIILLIDEMHTLIGAGSAEGAMDAANILKPPLARGELQCIGATTQDEYKRYVEKDAALQRRFQPIHVPEPTVEQSVEILAGLRKSYELFHTVTYTNCALEAAAKFSDQFISDRFLPDKAIDLLDQSGARANLSYTSNSPEARHIELEREAIRYVLQLKDEALRLGLLKAIEPLDELEQAWRTQLFRLMVFIQYANKRKEAMANQKNNSDKKDNNGSDNSVEKDKKKVLYDYDFGWEHYHRYWSTKKRNNLNELCLFLGFAHKSDDFFVKGGGFLEGNIKKGNFFEESNNKGFDVDLVKDDFSYFYMRYLIGGFDMDPRYRRKYDDTDLFGEVFDPNVGEDIDDDFDDFDESFDPYYDETLEDLLLRGFYFYLDILMTIKEYELLGSYSVFDIKSEFRYIEGEVRKEIQEKLKKEERRRRVEAAREMIYRDDQLEDLYDYFNKYAGYTEPLVPKKYPVPSSVFKNLGIEISSTDAYVLGPSDLYRIDDYEDYDGSFDYNDENQMDPEEISRIVVERYDFLKDPKLKTDEDIPESIPEKTSENTSQNTIADDLAELIKLDELESEQIKRLTQNLLKYLSGHQDTVKTEQPSEEEELKPLLDRETLDLIRENGSVKVPKYIFERICIDLGNPPLISEMQSISKNDPIEVRRAILNKKTPGRPEVNKNSVAEIVATQTGIPIADLTKDESKKLQNLELTLHDRVIGQDAAVDAVASAVRRARVGIRNPNRPIASFMFCGPTGVGKTELTKTLAENMFGSEDAIIRLDMSEYMERHTVAQLLGAPPGYIGYTEGGQLTEKVRRKPYSVVLFDEIEKAHPDILDILLQLLDDGRLTDSQGRVVSFKNTIVILTSNLGAHIVQAHIMANREDFEESDIDGNKPIQTTNKPSIGFISKEGLAERMFLSESVIQDLELTENLDSTEVIDDDYVDDDPYDLGSYDSVDKEAENHDSKIKKSNESYNILKDKVFEELRSYFRPEFLNRLDEIIVFRQLNRSEVKLIGDLMLKDLASRLEYQGFKFEISDVAKEKLLDAGYDPIFGARPMRRAITKLIESGISEKLLEEETSTGATIQVDIDPNSNLFIFKVIKIDKVKNKEKNTEDLSEKSENDLE